MGRARVSTNESVAGRYRLVEVLHRETNLRCWYADDTRTGRPCLVMESRLPEDPLGELLPHVPDRVLRTTEDVTRLCPGRMATVIEAVAEAGCLWTATTWIDGTSLGALLAEQGTFNHVRAARVGLELLDVLDAAHTVGITHGELGPGHVFVRDTGPVVVTGWGLSQATDAPRLTAPAYASPEQARGERIGPATDLWALGALLYTMLEGRPPYRDRGRPEATLKGVDRLPLRTPLRAGPLTRLVQGLLRKDPRERLDHEVAREVLTRIVNEDSASASAAPVPGPRLRDAAVALRGVGREWSRRTMVVGTTLAVMTVAVAVLTATQALPGGDSEPETADTPSPSASSPGAPGAPGATDTPGDAPSAPPSSAAPSPSPSDTDKLPPGFQLYRAPEGFSVALPEGWKRLDTSRAGDVAYRVTFGAEQDPRTLAVTYSERVGPDPVAVWRDDVEPALKRDGDYDRIGEIRATKYQGRRAADMEWTEERNDTRVRTFGRGVVLGAGRGFSLRWTTPADDWDDAESRRALETFLRTFRPAAA